MGRLVIKLHTTQGNMLIGKTSHGSDGLPNDDPEFSDAGIDLRTGRKFPVLKTVEATQKTSITSNISHGIQNRPKVSCS